MEEMKEQTKEQAPPQKKKERKEWTVPIEEHVKAWYGVTMEEVQRSRVSGEVVNENLIRGYVYLRAWLNCKEYKGIENPSPFEVFGYLASLTGMDVNDVQKCFRTGIKGEACKLVALPWPVLRLAHVEVSSYVEQAPPEEGRADVWAWDTWKVHRRTKFKKKFYKKKKGKKESKKNDRNNNRVRYNSNVSDGMDKQAVNSEGVTYRSKYARKQAEKEAGTYKSPIVEYKKKRGITTLTGRQL